MIIGRTISPNFSDQGDEGTCYAHVFTRVFINNIIKLVYPVLFTDIKTKECLFQFETHEGPDWSQISETTCGKYGLEKLLLFYYIFYFCYNRAAVKGGGASISKKSILVNDLFYKLKHDNYQERVLPFSSRIPNIPHELERTLLTVLIELSNMLFHIDHIDYISCSKSTILSDANQVFLADMDAGRKPAPQQSEQLNIFDARLKWRALIDKCLDSHVYIELITQDYRHAVCLVGYNGYNYYIKNSAESDLIEQPTTSKYRATKKYSLPYKPYTSFYVGDVLDMVDCYNLMVPRTSSRGLQSEYFSNTYKKYVTKSNLTTLSSFKGIHNLSAYLDVAIEEIRILREEVDKQVMELYTLKGELPKVLIPVP
jgi:hypothetical protein